MTNCRREWSDERSAACERGASSSSSSGGSVLSLLVWVDHGPGLVLAGREHGLGVHAAELVELCALDVAVLHLEHPAFVPLAALAELDVPHDGLEGGGADVVGELVVIEALGCLHGVAEYLDIGVAPGAEVIAERIDALGGGAVLVLLEE